MKNQEFLNRLREEISPVREDIINHPLYAQIQTIRDVRCFMEHHVFAVWDFMSLLKVLQNQLTCTRVPWLPSEDGDTAWLINEIVVGEETDEDEKGVKMSHYELYYNSMKQAGASTTTIDTFITKLKQGISVTEALEDSLIPGTVKDFVKFTFACIEEGKTHVLAAVFTFGREDLIPGMFISMMKEMQQSGSGEMNKFVYYLERHIEVDGGHHGELALRMTSMLCGDDAEKWEEATRACVLSLQMRKQLWDGVLHQIQTERVTSD